MNRRHALSLLSAAALPFLPGCGGSSAGGAAATPPPPAPVQPTVTYSLGLNPATSAILQSISPVTANSFDAVAPGEAAAQTYFDMSDTALLALMGWPSVLPAPGDQGPLSSCVAWGAGYAMASTANAIANAYQPDTGARIVSPADLYAKILRRENAASCGNGTYVRDAMDILVEEGVATLQASPYLPNQCVAPNINAPFFIDGYMRIAVTDRAAIKRALDSMLVLPFGMQVHDNFRQLGTGIYNGPGSGNQALGGHCMAIVGYDDRNNTYRVLNSWGTSWGNRGFGQIAYATFERYATEVYVPFATSARMPNNLLGSSESQGSNTIQVLKANAMGGRDAASSSGYSAHFGFKLSDYLRVNEYSLVFWKKIGDATDPTIVASRTVQQSLRGAIFSVPLVDGTLLSTSSQASINLDGTDRYGVRTRISIFIKYPGVGAR